MSQTPAVVFTDIDRVEVRDIEMPPPGPGQVQMRTWYSTISAGTEGWVFQNRFTWQPTVYPCVPGYQRVGEIVALGEGVEGWRVGDVAMATVGTWQAPVCSFWGSHALVANTVASELYRLPAGADPVDASAAVVAQVGYNAAYRAAAPQDGVAVVYGDGVIGQFGAQCARARGLRTVLVGRRPERLELARLHCADAVVNARSERVVEDIRAFAGRQTVDIVIDTVQTVEAQMQYIDLLQTGRGQVVYSGFTPGDTWADMGLLQKRELTTHYVAGWTRPRMEATLDLMACGKVRLGPIATHRAPYREAADMYRMIREKSAPFLGIVIDWTGA